MAVGNFSKINKQTQKKHPCRGLFGDNPRLTVRYPVPAPHRRKGDFGEQNGNLKFA